MEKRIIPAERTAVVTGAGGLTGIGFAAARALAGQGWAVALVDISEGGVRLVEQELRAMGYDQVRGVATDVTSERSVADAFRLIDQQLPPVVGLANLAGIPCTSTLHECGLDEFERVMAVNVTGSYLMLREAAARMIPQFVGRVVNASSITAFDGGGTFSKGVYATAKAAVLGMSRGAARELGPHGITVNSLALGPVDTEIMGGTLTDERKAAMSANMPLQRIGQPSEIGETIAFVFSDAAGYMTGSTIQVDGGKHMF